MEYTALDDTILEGTQNLVREEFRIAQGSFYHYTSLASANLVATRQIFHASFIRSSSDSLEFAGPMAACRDTICLSDVVFQHTHFPISWFNHFNEQTISPVIRPYFISLTSDANSSHMKSMYGDTVMEFKFTKDLNQFGFFIGCKYVENIELEVERLIRRWRNEVLDPAFAKHGVDNPISLFEKWFYTLMQFCHTISVGLKKSAFEKESETRVVLFPKPPDVATTWHGARATGTLIQREYLPVYLNGIGCVAYIPTQ